MRSDDITGAFRFEGKVVDAEGAPVADAEVRLRPSEKRATTDLQGAFAFDALSSRRFWVSARKDEFYAGPTVVRVVESTAAVLLQMHRGATLIVHVIADRAPVAGAAVALERDCTSATTDANGIATIHGLSPEYHDGWVRADGWAPAFVGMFLDIDPGGVIEHHVSLRQGARVEGVVLGPGERPVADTNIVLWRAVEGSFVSSTSSGADGTWSIDAVEAGRFRVVASSNEYLSRAEHLLECDGRTPQRDVVVRVDVGAEIHGCVVDKNGQPVPAAHIDAKLYHAGGKQVFADDQGRFQIRGLEPGEYYVDACTPTQASAPAHIHLERGKSVEVKLELDDARVAGIVIDDKSEPVVGVAVRAQAREIYVPYRLEATTDSRGRFDLGPLQLGEYDLYVTCGKMRLRDEAPAARVRSGESDLRIVLAHSSVITGRVLLDGKPLPYFGVSLAGEKDAPHETGVRDENGRFSFRVPPGTWQLKLLGPGTALKGMDHVSVEHGQLLDLGDIDMPRGQHIQGHVRDANGSPVPNALVKIGRGIELQRNEPQLKQWFKGEYETTTDKAGAYAFEGIAAPSWGRMRLICATHPTRGASLVQQLPQDDSTLDFALLASGTIEGTVESGGRHRFVDAVRAEEPSKARWTGTRNDFRFDDVPVGEYDLTLHGGNEAISTTRVTVAADHCTRVKLVVVSSSVRLTIRVPRGRANDLVIERAEGSASGRVGRGTMIMDDRVTFSDVEPGAYRISLDRATWVPIVVVEADPPEQTVVFPTDP